MANEISLTAQLNCTKSGVTIAASVTKQITQAGNANIGSTQNIATAAEALVLGDVATIGYVMIVNLDATNYVEIDLASAMDKWPQKLLPGEAILLKPQSSTIFGKANTAACDIQIIALEL